jgi:hypothetical protein
MSDRIAVDHSEESDMSIGCFLPYRSSNAFSQSKRRLQQGPHRCVGIVNNGNARQNLLHRLPCIERFRKHIRQEQENPSFRYPPSELTDNINRL